MPNTDLATHERKVYSQNGEDGVLEAIFNTIGTTNRFFVEFGCQDATECNTAFLLEKGWQGLLMDGAGVSANPRATVHKEFITAENISALFPKYGVPICFDLLSIDIDGNDYWVWRAILARPRVVVIEYNAHVPPHERKSIAYDPNFRWNGSDYFGASLRALNELGREKGYTLIYCERTGVNAFFVATDELPGSFVAKPLEEIYRPPNYLNRGLRHPRDRTRIMVDPIAELGLVSCRQTILGKGMLLELGSGKAPTIGYVHHDRTQHSSDIDVVHDLDILPWPWADESCDEVLALDVFAHLQRMPAEWLRECHRLLVLGGILRLRVPIFGSPWHIIDPTHVRGFHLLNFDYFVRGRELFAKYGCYYFDFAFSSGTVQIEQYNIVATLTK